MKRISPDSSSDPIPLSACHKQFSIPTSSPVFTPQNALPADFHLSPPLNPIRREGSAEEGGEKETGTVKGLPLVPSTSNFTAGISFPNSADYVSVNVFPSACNTSAQNCSSDKTDKTSSTKEVQGESSREDAGDGVFKRSRVDSKRYQAEVSHTVAKKDAALRRMAEEVKEHCRFEAKDSAQLETIANFLQFVQRLNNEWTSAGGSGP